MAHYAKVVKSKVTDIMVADSDYIQTFIDDGPGKWIKTSYNTVGDVHLDGGTPLRKNFAGIGHTYDETRDAFYAPKPYSSWILNDSSCEWEPPIDHPHDGRRLKWNEDIENWDSSE